MSERLEGFDAMARRMEAAGWAVVAERHRNSGEWDFENGVSAKDNAEGLYQARQRGEVEAITSRSESGGYWLWVRPRQVRQ